MEYITTKEASAKWGISTIRITVLANEGRIPGAKRLGRSWLIPANANKPPERKANHSKTVKGEKEEIDNFSFPLYHFRPDWHYINQSQLSEQQQELLSAETAVLECRYEYAYPILKSILRAPDDIATEIGALWAIEICCICLNKPGEFSKFYLRLQLILAKDFPHRDDLAIIFDFVETYVETVRAAAKYDLSNSNIHEQSLPMLCMLTGYANLTREILKSGTADTTLMELNLRLLKDTGAVVVTEAIHLYLLGIYNLHQNLPALEKHARMAVQIAYENKYYFPLVTYYQFFAPILAPILAEYPESFQFHLNRLATQYEENFTLFLSSVSKYSVVSQLTSDEEPYIYSVLLGLSNAAIADRLGVSIRTVNRKLDMICEKFGVSHKKDLKDFLYNFI